MKTIKKWIDKDTLEKLYYDDSLSTTDIGKIYGLTKGQVHYQMVKYDLKRLKRGKKATRKRSHYIPIDKDELYDLYWNKGYSLKMLAEAKYFCSHPTLINRMKEFGIPRKKKQRGEGRTEEYVKALWDSLYGE